ncbi:ATP-binding protein [Acidianus manzaensis]|uniref:ATP-binding protein n=1 Tax=Acidianus manzaensis TaxID=282676 RepID=UPI001F1C8916|nr:DUF4143 domain-containing protein [Acidianus manzaensis]
MSLLRNYLYYGGYPAVVLEKDVNLKKRLLRSYFDSVVIRDIDEKYGETFATYIISNYSSLISYNRVYNYFKSMGYSISKEKVIEMFNKAKESYFLFEVEIFNKSENKRKANPRKVYVIDNGYRFSLGYEFSISKAMENIVFLQLRREGKEVYYWKENGKSEGAEIDFVVSENFEVKEIIQVTYAEDKVEEREIKSLKKAEKELKPEKITLITWNINGKIKDYDAIPLWYWLLEREK